MNERDLKILEQYDLEIGNVYRTRGAYLCETKTGPVILREYQGSAQKAESLQGILLMLQGCGHLGCDFFIRNKEGGLLSMDKDENKFAVKRWSRGRECDVESMEEIKKAIRCLGILHKEARELTDENIPRGVEIGEVFSKRMKELRKIKNYIRNKKKRVQFEQYFYNNFCGFYSEAEQACLLLSYEGVSHAYEKAQKEGELCHGDYNQHNILLNRQEAFLCNFEKSQIDVQMEDLYHFIRKMMEKKKWDTALADDLLRAYDMEKPLTKEDLQNLYVRFCFPEKFWKVSNFYLNSKKSCVSARSTGKLEAITLQRSQKEDFLKFLEKQI